MMFCYFVWESTFTSSNLIHPPPAHTHAHTHTHFFLTNAHVLLLSATSATNVGHGLFVVTVRNGLGLSFSSGFLVSLDDFYLLGSNLMMTQTTNNVFNSSLYDTVTPSSLLAWQRVRLAHSLAHTGEEWAKTFSKYNSGEWLYICIALSIRVLSLLRDKWFCKRAETHRFNRNQKADNLSQQQLRWLATHFEMRKKCVGVERERQELITPLQPAPPAARGYFSCAWYAWNKTITTLVSVSRVQCSIGVLFNLNAWDVTLLRPQASCQWNFFNERLFRMQNICFKMDRLHFLNFTVSGAVVLNARWRSDQRLFSAQTD